MVETTSIEGLDMSISHEKAFEVPLERQRFIVTFPTDKADLNAQEVICRMGKVTWIGERTASIDGKMKAALDDLKIPYTPISRTPDPVTKTLRK